MMFAGVYWAAREESKEAAAVRLSGFLRDAATLNSDLGEWYEKSRDGRSNQPLDASEVALVGLLRENRSDDTGAPFPELGFSLGLWNGGHVSFSATLGAWSRTAPNSAVLTARGAELEGPKALDWRRLLNTLVQHFEPDRGVVTSHTLLDSHDAALPWEVGWFTYERGQNIVTWDY